MSGILLTSLFVGFSLVVNGFLFDGEDVSSCANRCGKAVNHNYECQCNEQCTKYGDCCNNYQTLCVASSSCAGRCDTNMDKQFPCQCNTHCTNYGDCCSDYQAQCVGTVHSGCRNSSQLGQALWQSDTNRLSALDLTLNYQTHVSYGTSKDMAHDKLFTKVDESKFSRPTFATFLKLLDNFNPTKGVSEHTTSPETAEVNAFLDNVLDTKVMGVLLDFLKCKGTVTSKSGLKTFLHTLWFEPYSRRNGGQHLDTSGFEHIMVGEYTDNTKVNGFHSWLSFYTKEKAGRINYLGYVSRKDPNIIGPAFTWNGHLKTIGTFIVGSSPEFDLAIYTLCYVTHKNDVCKVTLDGHSLDIKTYDVNGHIATAHIV